MNAMHVTNSLRLTTPSGVSLPVETAWFRDENPPTMRVLLSWDAFERVSSDLLFGFDRAAIPADLVPDTDVAIEARLKEDVDFPPDRSALRKQLANPEYSLRSTTSWLGTEIQQAPPLADTKLIESAFDTGDEPTVTEFTLEQSSSRFPTREPADGAIAVDALAAETNTKTGSALDPVIEGLEAEGWPYEIIDDGAQIELDATLDETHWPVRIHSVTDGLCVVTSTVPAQANPEDEASTYLSYNGEIRRGGFAFDETSGKLQFRTPFAPEDEPTSDVLAENLTAVAEHL